MTIRERLLLAVIMSGSATTALVLVVLIPVLPLLAAHFGGGSEGAQLSQAIMTSPALGLIAGGFLSAAAIKYVGAFRLLLLGLALYGLAGTTGLYLSSAPLLLGARFLLGVAASFVGIASTTIIALRFDEIARARLLGFKGALGSVGGITGILIAGELGTLGGWRLPFAIYAFGWVLLILAIIARSAAMIQQDSAASAAAVTAPKGEGLLSLWPFYALIVAFGVVLMMTATQLSFLLNEIGVLDPSAVGRIAVMASVGAVIGGVSYGKLLQMIGPRYFFALIFANWTIGLAALGFAETPLAVSIGCLIAGISAGLFLPHMIASLVAAANVEVRARAIAMLYSAIFLGDFLNPFIIEPIAEALTRHGAFRAVAGFTLAATLVAGFLSRRHRSSLASA
jgi:MFS family permease